MPRRPPDAAGTDTHDHFVGVAEKLAPMIQGAAGEAEAQRRVTDEVMDAADETGLFRMVASPAWGGAGLGLATLADTTRIMAHGCPATAWTLSFLVMHNWLLARFPTELQREMFERRPYALVPAPLAPTGHVERVDGGYRLSGRWEWATGVNHADWVMVHAIDAEAGATRFVVMPIEAWTVEDVWFTSGMRATGSNAVIADDLYVPESHTTAGETMLGGGRAVDGELGPLPVMAVLALVAAGPALGAAEASVDLFRERIRERVLAYTLGDRQVDQPAAQIRLSTARAEVRAARALWDRAIAGLTVAATAPGGPTVQDRAEARLDAAATVRMSRAVISTVCEGSGASIYADSSPLQRLQRDVEVLKGHVVFDWDRAAEIVGRVELGLELRPTDLI